MTEITGDPEGMDAHGRGMIRLCILLPRLKIGGAEMQVLGLLRHLDRRRYEPHVCCLFRGDPSMEEQARRLAGEIRFIGFRWRNALFSFPRLVRYLRSERFDIVHAHLGIADALGRVAGIMAGVPVLITTEHGKHLWKRFPHLLLERMLIGRTCMRICVSDDIARIRMQREGTPEEKTVVIPNAVDAEALRGPARGRAAVMAELGWDPGDPLVLSVGRLVAAKDYPLLMESVALLRREFPAVRCLIAGEGDRRAEIEAAIARLGLESAVRLAGARRDVPDLLAAADVFVLSSVREGLPVSLLEAMAAGTPIAATAAGGIPEAVRDGESAILVAPGDARALAGAVGRLLGNRDLCARLAAAAGRTVEERYSAIAVTRRIESVYDDCLARRAGT